MAADTRVSITVDTGNAEGSLNRLRSVFQSLDAATNTTSRNLDNAGRASQNVGTRATSAATAITGLSRASTTANTAMTSLHSSTFTYIGNTTQATSAATSLTFLSRLCGGEFDNARLDLAQLFLSRLCGGESHAQCTVSHR